MECPWLDENKQKHDRKWDTHWSARRCILQVLGQLLYKVIITNTDLKMSFVVPSLLFRTYSIFVYFEWKHINAFINSNQFYLKHI